MTIDRRSASKIFGRRSTIANLAIYTLSRDRERGALEVVRALGALIAWIAGQKG